MFHNSKRPARSAIGTALLSVVAVFFGGLVLCGCGTQLAADPQDAAAPPPAAPAAQAAAQDDGPECPAADSVRSPERPDQRDAAPGVDTAERLPFRHRARAPSLDGGIAWLNTAQPLRLEDLRGKFVVLDFWAYCCINCMHVLPELKKLEQKYPNQIVVVGVHAAKYDGERETENIARAVERLEISHPVVNDAAHEIWDRYDVSAWPTLQVIDPEGYLVAMNDGEIDFESLDRFFRMVMPYYRARKLLDETPRDFHVRRAAAPVTPLRFPGKVLADEASRRLVVSDTGHNRIVMADLDGKVLDVIGSGAAGADDGDYRTASFDHPQGTALQGDMLYVADTENHLVRRVDLLRKQVVTVAGTGRQGHGFWPGFDQVRIDPEKHEPVLPDRWVCPPRQARLASPWALWVHGDGLYIAMAGAHQIWRMSLDQREIAVYAGDGREDVRDGKLLPDTPPRLARFGFEPGFASLAQPSGLTGDGRWLYVADSEGGSIRAVPLTPGDPMQTVVGPANLPRGRSLFTFGDRDGVGEKVRLQHPLGIVWHQGLLYVADSYNHKIKVIDPKTRTARTLIGAARSDRRDDPRELSEPGGLSVAAGRLYVADTNSHRIRTVDLVAPHRVRTLSLLSLTPPAARPRDVRSDFRDARRVEVPAATVRPVAGRILLEARLALPAGWHVNPDGPMRYLIETEGDAGPLDTATLDRAVAVEPQRRQTTLSIPVSVSGDDGQTRLAVSLAFYYCRDGADGVCKAAAVTWRVPLVVSPAAPETVVPLAYEVPQ